MYSTRSEHFHAKYMEIDQQIVENNWVPYCKIDDDKN